MISSELRLNFVVPNCDGGLFRQYWVTRIRNNYNPDEYISKLDQNMKRLMPLKNDFTCDF